MIHKLLAEKGKMKRGLSLLLCLALLGSSVISANVTAEAESEVTAETVGTTEDETDDTVTVEETTDAEEQIVAAAETGKTTAESATETTTEEVTDTTSAESTSPAVTLTGSYDGVDVTVEAPEGAFSEGVTMVVSEADVEAFKAAVLADCVENYPDETYTVIDVAAVDITFFDTDGNEVEPEKEVNVTLSGLKLATEDSEGTHTANYALVYHMNDDGSVEWIEDKEPGQQSYGFAASRFSSYGVATVEVEYEIDEAAPGDGGPGSGEGPGGSGGDQGGGDQGQDEGSESGTADHIDIGVTLTAYLVVNGETLSTTVTITEDDITEETLTVTAAYSDGSSFTGFTVDYENLDASTGTDSSGGTITQVRIGGSYPTGTIENPIYYTVTLTKEVTFTDDDGNEYTVTMTFTATFTYWDSNNTCPPLVEKGWSSLTDDEKKFYQGSGFDFALSAGSSSRTIIQIYKYVYDAEGNLITGDDVSGKTYTFSIYDSDGNYVESATVTVGSSGIGYYSTDVDPGSYYLVETIYQDEDEIGELSYIETNTSATYTPSEGNATTKNTSTITTAIMTANSDGSTVYTINNFYGSSTKTITVTKQVTGNMGDTTKEFTFMLSLTNNDGDAYTEVLTATKTSDSSSEELTLLYDSENRYYSFTLTDDETITIEVPYGYTYVVNETSYAGYTTTTSGDSISGSTTSDVSITYINDNDVEPDTGLSLDSAPYILMLAGVMAFGGAVLFRRRKRLL